MTTIEKINAWLESEDKNYQEGLALASEVITNRMLLNTLHRKENVLNRDKLNYELSKAAGAEYKPLPEMQPQYLPSVEKTVEGEEAGTITEVDGETDPLPETDDQKEKKEAFLRTLPEPVQVLYEQKRIAYDKRNRISQSMQDLTADGKEFDRADLEALKKEGEGYDEEIKAIDTQLDYYHQNGALPIKAEQNEPVTITADQKKAKLEELKRLIENKQTAVSKAKTKANKNQDNLSYATDQAKLEAELAALRFERDALKAQATV
jgi:hypothetical protein